MSAAFGLIMLAEVAATCSPASRFAGGAVIVRPVGKADSAPFKRLEPSVGIEKDKSVEQTGARTADPKPAETPKPCEAATHIV